MEQPDKHNEVQPRIRELQALGQPDKHLDVSGDEDIGVFQGDIAYTDPDSIHPILASYGAAGCVILATHNPETGVTALTHIDAATDLRNTIAAAVYGVRGKSSSDVVIEAHLAGATQGNGGESTLAGIVDILDLFDNEEIKVEIKSADVADTDRSESLAIDSRTGKVFTEFNPLEVPTAGVETEQDLDIKAQNVSMGFRREANTAYNGRGVSVPEGRFINDLRGVFSKASLAKSDYIYAAGPIEYYASQHENLFESDDFDAIMARTTEMYPQLEGDINKLRAKYETDRGAEELSQTTVSDIETKISAGSRLGI